MFFDSHVHTSFSTDSEMQAKDALAKAEELGIGLVFTEHLDIGFPGDVPYLFDPEEYWKEYSPLRGEHLLLGVEVGMRQETCEESLAFTDRAPFDVVVGSLHVLEDYDLYEPEIYGTRDKKELYHDYLMAMARAIYHHGFIDVLAHIDYIARYAAYEDPSLNYDEFAQDIDEVLRALVVTDTVLELNTKRLTGWDAIKELMPIYCRYRELGGRYITIGSDAHTPDAIGRNFHLAEEFVEECSLHPVIFCERRMDITS